MWRVSRECKSREQSVVRGARLLASSAGGGSRHGSRCGRGYRLRGGARFSRKSVIDRVFHLIKRNMNIAVITRHNIIKHDSSNDERDWEAYFFVRGCVECVVGPLGAARR